MRTMTRGKAALAGLMALGLALVAAPATAAEGDPVPTLTVANTTFTAGSWGDGVQATVTGVPETVGEAPVENVTIGVGSMGQNGGGLMAEVPAAEQGDGSWTGTVVPADAPIAPDANGFPKYNVFATYSYETGDGRTERVSSDAVELTITEGASVTGADEATVAQLAAGLPLQFAGFASNETLTGQIEYWNPATEAWESIGEFTSQIGEDGSGEGDLTITGDIAVGDQFRVTANGANSSVTHYVTVIADGGGNGGGGDDDNNGGGNGGNGGNGGGEQPPAPKKPERVETGR